MKKNTIVILIICLIMLLVVLLAGCILYLKTDLFKSNSQMFQKYFAQDVSFINDITNLSVEQQYIDALSQKNYRDNMNVKVSYKNSQGKIEVFNIASEGITNNEIKNLYRQINVKYGDDYNIMNAEFLQENQTYGILFSDVVRQFVSANITDVYEFLEKINIDVTDLKKNDIEEIRDLIVNKKDVLENICIDFAKQIDDEQYTKNKEEVITLSNGQSQNTIVYGLTLSSEQTKKLYIEILKEINNQKLIDEINETRREFAETQITIYVLDDKTSRVVVQYENREIRMDLYDNELNVKYSNLTQAELQTIDLSLKIDEHKKYIQYQDSKNNKIKMEFGQTQDINNSNANIMFNIQNQYINELEIELEQKLEVSNSIIEIQKKFENEENVNLDNLDTNTLNSALNSLLQRIDAKIVTENNEINSEILNMWLEKNKYLESKYQGVKERSIQDFNNLFLSYKGQNVEKNIIYNMLDVVEKNILKYEVPEEDKIIIYLKQEVTNTEMTQELKKIVEESDENFNINFQYDAEGKVNVVLMEKYKEEE